MVLACRAVVLGCSGYRFSADEERFFRDAQPWGLILFKRNVSDPSQLASLCARFRELVERSDAPVFVDQEGGRVQRLSVPNWQKYPAAGRFLTASGGDLNAAAELVRLAARLTAFDLASVGITANCMPVLDVPIPGAHEAIGDRAYSFLPEEVVALGRAAATGLISGGVLPVMKHMPGQGRAMLDSHEDLPEISASFKDLSGTDFVPFKGLSDLPIGMTGHVLFSAIDPSNSATMSKIVIENIVRGEIGFKGLLISDDLSMKALGGSFRQRAERLFSAGCDIALHCNGLMQEASGVVEGSSMLDGEALKRADAALELIKLPPEGFDPVEGRQKLDAMLAHSL